MSEETSKTDINITNNVFTNNYATQKGTVFSVLNQRGSLNTVRFTNNTFINNTCLQDGGVFNFKSVMLYVRAVDNYYENNVGALGGVGYAGDSQVNFKERNGTYIGKNYYYT